MYTHTHARRDIYSRKYTARQTHTRAIISMLPPQPTPHHVANAASQREPTGATRKYALAGAQSRSRKNSRIYPEFRCCPRTFRCTTQPGVLSRKQQPATEPTTHKKKLCTLSGTGTGMGPAHKRFMRFIFIFYKKCIYVHTHSRTPTHSHALVELDLFADEALEWRI